jgi:uncharacterized protein YqjF (DUF2071 family)
LTPSPGLARGRRRFVIPDRPAPVRLPVMFQNWYRLSFLHWPCDPARLQARLPVGLEIDTFDRTGWVGLTPFHLMGLRPPFLPAISCVSDFPEMNLRTYVRGPSGPGIWFFSLDAASAAAVLGARLTYGLPYYWSRMSVPQRKGIGSSTRAPGLERQRTSRLTSVKGSHGPTTSCCS